MNFKIPKDPQEPQKSENVPQQPTQPQKKGATPPKKDSIKKADFQGVKPLRPGISGESVPILIRPASQENSFGQTLVVIKGEKPPLEDFRLEDLDDGMDEPDTQKILNRLTYLSMLLDALFDEEGVELDPLKDTLSSLLEKSLHSLRSVVGEKTFQAILAKWNPEGRQPMGFQQQVPFIQELVEIVQKQFPEKITGVQKDLSAVFSEIKTLSHDQNFQKMLTQKIVMMHPEGELGKQVLPESVSQWVVSLGQQLGILSASSQVSSSQKHLATLLAQLVSGGAVLGAALARMPRGHFSLSGEEAIASVVVQFQGVKELGIVDEMPFNLFALFSPFEQDRPTSSDAEKEAKESLSQLIRAMMRIIFLLVAIQTGGKKLGKGGVNTLLEECAMQLSSYLDDLIFLLKKIDQLYGVNSKTSLLSALGAKETLTHKQYDQFWEYIFHIFAADTPLKDFLEEMEGSASITEAVSALFSPKQGDHPFLPG